MTQCNEMAKYVSESCNNYPATCFNRAKSSVLMVQFKNGNLIPSIKSKLKFTCYTKDGKNARILVANSKRLSYIGSNFESNMSKIATSMLKVCVLNKKSSTVKLYDADFFQMKPHLKAPNVIDVKTDKSYMEKSSDLTLAFGSKIQKKKINTNMKYNSNSMNSDAVDNILTTMLKTPIEDSTATSSTESSVSSAIPPRNDSAPTIDEVYNIYDIISKEELDVLDSDAEIFLDVKANVIQQWKSENKYPSFILQFLEQNFCSMNVYKAKLLCYLNYMFRFLKTTYADWKKKEPIPVSDVPEPFRQKIMESFTINKQMPMRLKDKLLAYALVLALKLNSYCINANIFAASTKVSSKRMTSVAYALGCHTSESKSDAVKMIYLKLPLYKFQELPKKRKK